MGLCRKDGRKRVVLGIVTTAWTTSFVTGETKRRERKRERDGKGSIYKASVLREKGKIVGFFSVPHG